IFEIDEREKFEEFMKHIHPEDLQKVKEAIERSFTTGVYEAEYRYIKNQKEKTIWSLGKVEFKNGRPERMIGTIQDITEIKKIERELIQKTKDLENSNK